jgi:CxxC motif-containing protein (DUF1111 family)
MRQAESLDTTDWWEESLGRSGRKGDRMTIGERMLDTYPGDLNADKTLLARCIEACSQCDQACAACADACLSEQGEVESLVKCIRLNLDCADICAATARVVSRQTEYDANVTRSQLEACIAGCTSCANECELHAQRGMEHCRVCAEQCRICEQACNELLQAIA